VPILNPQNKVLARYSVKHQEKLEKNKYKKTYLLTCCHPSSSSIPITMLIKGIEERIENREE
jgi:hypothetical protein